MFKVVLMLMTLFPVSCRSQSADFFDGYWEGRMGLNGRGIDISLHIENGSGAFCCSDLALYRTPLSGVNMSGDRIEFGFEDMEIPIRFHGICRDGILSGPVTMDTGGTLPALDRLAIHFRVTRLIGGAPKEPYVVEKHTVCNGDIRLDAQIYKSFEKGKRPALVLLPGSMSREKKDLAFYADFFARKGMVALIFDKRGSGRSSGSYDCAGYNDFAEDAIACLRVLWEREEVDRSRIGLWGISQGALLLPFIASQTEIPSFLIAVSPEVRSVTDAAVYQDCLRLKNRGYSREDVETVAQSHRTVSEMIERGSSHREVETFIRDNARKHPFMNRTGLHEGVRISQAEYSGFYWKGRTMNFFPYWKRLSTDTLVIFGGRDQLVDAFKNRALLEGLNSAHIQIRSFDQAGHMLKLAVDPMNTPAEEIDWPRLLPEYLSLLTFWNRSRGKIN